jgi:peptidoglycan L-alanyl-D-glutamate endopeptidase CwlK
MEGDMLSERTKKNLIDVHPDLVLVFTDVAGILAIEVIEGKRSKIRQAELVAKGLSKRLDGKHTTEPYAEAVDVVPMPLDWKDMKRFYYLAGIVKAVALARKVKIRWGGDWDGDHDFKDQTFNDLVHFELA